MESWLSQGDTICVLTVLQVVGTGSNAWTGVGYMVTEAAI